MPDIPRRLPVVALLRQTAKVRRVERRATRHYVDDVVHDGRQLLAAGRAAVLVADAERIAPKDSMTDRPPPLRPVDLPTFGRSRLERPVLCPSAVVAVGGLHDLWASRFSARGPHLPISHYPTTRSRIVCLCSPIVTPPCTDPPSFIGSTPP